MIYRMTRGCPTCGDAFESYRTRSYSYERCGQCCGVWISPGVLDEMIRDMTGNWRARPLEELDTRSADVIRNCPDCQRPLATVELFRVPLDACLTQQHGVWFDHDELRQVLERSREEDPAPPEPTPQLTSLLADFFRRT